MLGAGPGKVGEGHVCTVSAYFFDTPEIVTDCTVYPR